jgi:hypothetical protein
MFPVCSGDKTTRSRMRVKASEAGARFGAAACAFGWSENRSRVLVRFPKSSSTAVYVNKIVAGLLSS